jgi:hypothetical protein
MDALFDNLIGRKRDVGGVVLASGFFGWFGFGFWAGLGLAERLGEEA